MISRFYNDLNLEDSYRLLFSDVFDPSVIAREVHNLCEIKTWGKHQSIQLKFRRLNFCKNFGLICFRLNFCYVIIFLWVRWVGVETENMLEPVTPPSLNQSRTNIQIWTFHVEVYLKNIAKWTFRTFFYDLYAGKSSS